MSHIQTTQTNQYLLKSPDQQQLTNGDSKEMSLRGETDISSQVIEKIATKVTSDTPAVAQVKDCALLGGAEVSKISIASPLQNTSLALTIAMYYPEPIAQVCALIRHNIQSKVYELTRIKISSIEITVSNLIRPTPVPSPRVI